MLLKVIALAKLLAALADSEAFKALMDLLNEWLADREPLFGAAVDGNADLQEFKALCLSQGVSETECDAICGKLAAEAAE